MTLTKADIVQKIADGCGFSKGEATEIVEKLLDIIKTEPHPISWTLLKPQAACLVN